MLNELEEKTSEIGGVVIEDNRFCISVHYRHVQEEVRTCMPTYIYIHASHSYVIGQHKYACIWLLIFACN